MTISVLSPDHTQAPLAHLYIALKCTTTTNIFILNINIPQLYNVKWYYVQHIDNSVYGRPERDSWKSNM